MTVSGRITFDRVPFSTVLGNGLDYGQTVERPARRVVVEALRPNETVIETTSTDDNGNYSLSVPSGSDVKIRAKAQSLVTATTGAPASWNVSVRNNTDSDALYVLDSAVFNVGTTAQTRNLRAASGWSGTSYDDPRAAAPFAILDTMYASIRFVVDQGGYAGSFPALDVFWSSLNTAAAPTTACGLAAGCIGTTGYQPGGGGLSSGIYVLGLSDAELGAATDTDEFDQHVLAHEFQHYVEDKLSRADTLGGEHGLYDRLDLRVAFSEGFANAFCAMVLGDPAYRDSAGVWPSYDQIYFSVEVNPTDVNPDGFNGWFTEASLQSIVWDLFDTVNEGVDTGSVGFRPMFDVFRTELRTDVPLNSIFAFAAALKQRAGVDDVLVNAVVGREQIVASTINAYAVGETNDGGLPDVLPVYAQLTLNGPTVQVCGTRDAGVYNKLGNRRHLRFNVPSTRPVQITVTAQNVGTPIPDPDLIIWKAGFFGYSDCAGPVPGTRCTLPQYSESYNNDSQDMPAGDYVLEVYEYSHVAENPVDGRRGETCMFVTING